MSPDQPTQQAAPQAINPLGSEPLGTRHRLPTVVKLIAVLVVIALAFSIYLTAINLQIQDTSDKFMKLITTGNVEEAAKLTSATSAGDKSFLNTAATAVKGSSKLTDSGKRDKKHYFLYELSGAPSKYARTTLEEQDGKWLVISFVYNKETLKLFPDESSNTSQPSSSAPAPTPSACLSPTDFDTIFKQINGSTASLGTLDYSKSTNPYTSNVHFNPDSLDFSAPAAANQGVVNAFASFGKQYSDKSFTISLRGSVGTTKQSDIDFARQRSEKIKAMLVAGGVPESKIVIEAPGSVGDYGNSNDVNKQTARNVVLKINSTCSQQPESGR